MKNLLLLLSLTISSITLNATTYYMSATGNDANSGTSSSLAWQTIPHLNLQSLLPGDSILFKCGDTFRGNLTINQGGISTTPVIITSYGSGNKPIISGAEQIVSWTFNGTYYQANFASSISTFFVDGIEQTLARYPNNHQYLNFDSTSTTYLKDQSLLSISPTLVNNSKICVHTAQWCWEKSDISAFASNKITYATSMVGNLSVGFGYFLYNNITHLDTCGEWYYNSTSQQISYMPSVNQDPNTMNCEGSVYANGIQFGTNVSYVNIIGIAFAKQSNCGIYIPNGNNKYIIIDNCDFQNQYNHGIYSKGRFTEIKNSYFRSVDGIAVYTNGTAFKPLIHDNIFRNIGEYRNGGVGAQINLSAIMCASTDSVYIDHNNIDSCGYCCISVDGGYGIIERNIVSHAMLIVNDGGALKSFGYASHNTIFRNNFISYGDGNTEGAPNAQFVTPALYFDNFVSNNTFKENTVYNRSKKGIFINSGANNNTIDGNVIYGGNCGIDLNGSQMTTTQITGMVVKHNVFFMRDNNGYCLRQVDFSNLFNTGIIDSNYYFQPYDPNHVCLRYISNVATPYSFPSWQGTGNDLNTQPSFVSWVYPVDSSQLFMNPTDNVVTIPLGTYEYLDLDSNIICGNLTLQPYSSKVLIQTSTICNTGINQLNFNTEISIYPNPADEEINIFIPNFKTEIPFALTDGLGKNIQVGFLTSESSTLNISELAPGIYFLRTFGDSPAYKKIIVN